MPSTPMPWIKVYTEILDDAKLARVDERDRWRFVAMLVYAGELDQEGYIGDAHDVAWRLRIKDDEAALTIDALCGAGVLECETHGLLITKFSTRQGRPQSEKREQWKSWQRKHRGTVSPDSGMTKAGVKPDSGMSHATEQSRGEQSKAEERTATAPAAAAGVAAILQSLNVGKNHIKAVTDSAVKFGFTANDLRKLSALIDERTDIKRKTGYFISLVHEGVKPDEFAGNGKGHHHAEDKRSDATATPDARAVADEINRRRAKTKR